MSMTYPQRLDALCEAQGHEWRVWEEWRQVSGFERKPWLDAEPGFAIGSRIVLEMAVVDSDTTRPDQ